MLPLGLAGRGRRARPRSHRVSRSRGSSRRDFPLPSPCPSPGAPEGLAVPAVLGARRVGSAKAVGGHRGHPRRGGRAQRRHPAVPMPAVACRRAGLEAAPRAASRPDVGRLMAGGDKRGAGQGVWGVGLCSQ